MAKPATKPGKMIEDLRQASARVYAQRAARSFGDDAALSEDERRRSYEQGWFDCLDVILGRASRDLPLPAARPNGPN